MRCAILLACSFVIATAASQSAGAQNLTNGERIAKSWCAACHRISPNAPISGANDAAPSFSSIARMGSTTEASLAAFLSTSHARMPDYSLTRGEIADVSAYILSLRK